MSAATRIYKVTSTLADDDADSNMGDGAPIARLVRATNVAQALRHVAADWLAAGVATQDDLVTLVAAGVKVEAAGEAGSEAPE